MYLCARLAVLCSPLLLLTARITRAGFAAMPSGEAFPAPIWESLKLFSFLLACLVGMKPCETAAHCCCSACTCHPALWRILTVSMCKLAMSAVSEQASCLKLLLLCEGSVLGWEACRSYAVFNVSVRISCEVCEGAAAHAAFSRGWLGQFSSYVDALLVFFRHCAGVLRDCWHFEGLLQCRGLGT